MNIELLKQAAELRNQFIELNKQFNELGAYGFYIDGEVQVKTSDLVGKENLEIKKRNSNEYPFEVFTFVEGIKIFAIAKTEELVGFPQFKEHRKAILLKELAELEKEKEATA